jgi:co-chaperonin GroES (HSP10)
MITTLHNNILFTFNDESDSQGFNNVSAGGIVYKSFDHDAKTPRWATVLVVGPDVKDVKAGDEILIENLRWSEGHEIDGLKIWMTQESEVMCVREQNTE